ncbi:MAG: TetR/AcrR family transcriptional regulator [Actinomycetota bacterium]|nr:TetR/AcrR family transcriptional regulator [Actinomycetota bacterium]
MSTTTDTAAQLGPPRPKRADARRNYEKVIAAARDAFAEGGSETSLEEIARRAEVGIGTLYRHFPTRQALLEAVYLDEVQALCRSAADLAELPPWDALVGWLRRFVEYLVTKQALAPELLNYVGRDAGLFKDSRAAFWAAGEPLLKRAQEARVARTDTDLTEVIQMVGGIAKIPASEPGQIEHILEMALDGLRYRG